METKNKKSVPIKRFLMIFFVIIVFLSVGFFLASHADKKPKPHIPQNIKYVEIGGQKIKVDLALTTAEQTQGLSGREGLPQDEGMLFTFDKPDKYQFWMKDMNFPIDIIWLSEDMKVDYIKKSARPELYPETYGPGESASNAKYVLEVVSGFSDKNNLKEGDSVEFTYQ